MTEIYIENQRVDVNDGLPAMLTLSIDDFKDFGFRNTSFSKTIVLPGTNRNNKVFGNIFDVRSANPYTDSLPNVNLNFNAAKRARCVVFQDNIQSFKGHIRLIEIVIDRGVIEYEVVLFGELYGLINAIGRARLEDLDFSDYDHVYNLTNIQNSWDNAQAGAGYYYPLADYGGYSTLKHDWNIGTFRPALFAKEYLEKIFAAANYTYDAPLFDTNRFKSLIVPYNRKFLTKVTTEAARATKTVTQQIFTGFAIEETTITYETVSPGNFTETGGVFTHAPADTQTFEVIFSGFVDCDGPTAQSFTIEIHKNFSLVLGLFFTVPAGTDGLFFVQLSGNVTLAQNDTVSIVASGIGVGVIVDMTSASLAINSEFPVATNVTPGDSITINNTLPKGVLQLDFLRSIVKLFNLYIYEDTNKDSHVKIAPYVDFFNGGAVDWTLKVDRSKPMRLTPMSQLTARFYDFKFKEDSDYYNDLYKKRYNEGYGQYIFDSAFDFENERQAVELIFAATPLVGYDGEDKVYSTILKIENNNETQTDSVIRLLQAKKVTGVTSWNIISYASGLTSYGYAGHFDDPDVPANDLNFGAPKELFFTVLSGSINVNQFNVYWSPYMAEITDKDSRLLRCKVKLTAADIFTLDFGKYVYIDGAYWRLVKVSDYNLTDPDVCEVELLKVINTIY